MYIIPLEDLLKNVDNRYELVSLAAKRCQQLMAGATPLINSTDNKRVNLIALEEIKAEKVLIKKR